MVSLILTVFISALYIEYLDDHKKTMSLPFNSDILMSIHVIGDAYR